MAPNLDHDDTTDRGLRLDPLVRSRRGSLIGHGRGRRPGAAVRPRRHRRHRPGPAQVLARDSAASPSCWSSTRPTTRRSAPCSCSLHPGHRVVRRARRPGPGPQPAVGRGARRVRRRQRGFAFPLLADIDKDVGRAYGILGPVGFYRRSVFVIDARASCAGCTGPRPGSPSGRSRTSWLRSALWRPEPDPSLAVHAAPNPVPGRASYRTST